VAEQTNRFQRDTRAVRQGEHDYRVHVDRGWWIVRGPNGGYVAALVLRALTAAVDDPTRAPRSLTIHFTAPPVEGEARVTTRFERVGRSLTTASARLEQEGRLCALALAAFSKERPGPSFDHLEMPDVPPPESCERLAPPAEGVPCLRARYESRHALGALPFSTQTDAAVTGGWIRLAERPGPIDAPLLAAYADGWPPAIFTHVGRDAIAGGVPTVDLTIHFRAPYPPDADPADYLLVVFRSRYAREGFVEEDGEIWTRGGRLLAQCRQLAVVG
jgi:acyl-CoA thioesterase